MLISHTSMMIICKSSGGDYSHSMVAGGFDEMS